MKKHKQFGIMVGLNKKSSFEGWFCKVDDRENDLMISVIWGYTTDEKTKHAFIQFQDSIEHRTRYIRYPIEALSWTEDPFTLNIGKNRLSQEEMKLELESEGVEIKGEFRFGEFETIEESFLKPNIMGWLSYLPNECNHAIISMNHRACGSLKIGGSEWEISEADSYIEKDWGTGFPEEYVWVQDNSWQNSSVVFSYASVPMLGKHRKGFFLLLHHRGREYRFSSIEGSKMLDFKATAETFEATIKKGKYILNLKARQLNPVELASPDSGEMKAKIRESLDGRIELSLDEKNGRLLSLESERASIDIDFGKAAVSD